MISPFFYKNNSAYYPYYRYRPIPYGYNKYSYNGLNYKETNKEKDDHKKINISSSYVNNSEEEKSKDKNKNYSSSSDNQAVFEIFGIKLFFDDILLISLIFFLYSEGVQDKSLFIALILILLS